VTIVMGRDQHRGQITAEWIDTATGEVRCARVAPTHREPVRRFVHRFGGAGLEGVGGDEGWRFVVEELRAVGGRVHLAEPAQTSDLRGSKKRAKSDRGDARRLRELLMVSRVPESWIAPDHLLDLRARVRLRHMLSEQRGEWQQRIQAVLHHHGCPQRRALMTREGARGWPGSRCSRSRASRSPWRSRWSTRSTSKLAPIDRELRACARRQPGCRALMAHYGIGQLTAVTILAELGDCRRFSSSRLAVRYSGLDITVHQSDMRRAPGHLSRQGPPALRWALFEAAQSARRTGSPDRDYDAQAAERLGATARA
jgi:transposase